VWKTLEKRKETDKTPLLKWIIYKEKKILFFYLKNYAFFIRKIFNLNLTLFKSPFIDLLSNTT